MSHFSRLPHQQKLNTWEALSPVLWKYLGPELPLLLVIIIRGVETYLNTYLLARSGTHILRRIWREDRDVRPPTGAFAFVSDMKMTNQQLQTFGRLSGNYNPVRTGAEYARRTMFGGQIVYGVYRVMLCLQEAVREMQHPLFQTSLKVKFRRAHMVEQVFHIDVEVHGGSVKATVGDRAVFFRVSFSYDQTESTGNPLAAEEFPTGSHDATKEETQSTTEYMGYSVELSRNPFLAARSRHRWQSGVSDYGVCVCWHREMRGRGISVILPYSTVNNRETTLSTQCTRREKDCDTPLEHVPSLYGGMPHRFFYV